MKKINLKKFFSLFMAIVLLLSVISLGEIPTSASGVTLESLKAKYPHGKYWNGGDANTYTSSPCNHHGNCSYSGSCGCNTFKGYAIQCMGFAYQLAYLVYGGNPYSNWTANRNVSALDSLKAGDVVRYKNDGHSIFVTAVSGDTVTYADCNSDGHCIIRWNQTISKSTLRATFTYVDVAPSAWNTGTAHTHSYSNSYFEAAHPHRIYQKCSCGKTQYTGKERAYSACSTCMKKSTTHPTPIKAYTLATGKTIVYDAVAGNQKSNKIYDTDVCTITAIYDCGWCKVTFPLDAGGTDSGYVKTSVFFSPTFSTFKINMGKQATTYARKDLSASTGYAASGDVVYVIGYTSTAVQIAYPLASGGYKVGWVPISLFKYTVKYNANGGSGTISNTSAYYKGNMQLSANTFTKTGNTFAGWNVYRSSDKKWYCEDVGWKTATQISDNGYTKKIYKDKMSCTLSSTWIKNGITNDTLTFYAVWNANKLSVYYNANGGTVSSDTYKLSSNLLYNSDDTKYVQTWTYNNKRTNGLINAATFGLTKTGHTFKGWGTSSSGGTVFDQSDTELLPTDITSKIKDGSCSKTLYAIWTPNTYSVKFDANGGKSAPTQQTKTYGKALTLSSTVPERDGYTFVGWGTSATATSASYQPGGSYTSNKSITLYAVWNEIEEIHTHNWDSDFTVDVEATCVQTGSKSIHCKGCDAKESITAIPMIEHNYETIITKEASCSAEGEQVDRCTECGYENNKSIIPMTEHNFVSVEIKDSTCTEEGLIEDVCTECEIHTNAVTIPKKDHDFGDWENTKQPTINEDGIDIRRCANCDKIETRLVKYDFETLGNSDLDGDGVVGADDLTEMLKILLGETVLNEQTSADINSDGTVDLLDLLRLKIIIAGML